MTKHYQHIDPAVLMNAAGDDEEGFKELLAMFLRIVPDMLRQLDQAVRDGRRADIGQHAHSLKSCLSLVGALACGTRLGELERAARTGTPGCGAGFRELHEEITRVIAEARECQAAGAHTN
jgi:HPt (histidine-containing phosphotransfer) domain-containing protein